MAITPEIIDQLSSCPLFRALNVSEIADLMEDSGSRVSLFQKGDRIAGEGEKVGFLHIVVSGSVKGEMMDFAGKVIKIEDILPPRPLATAFLFGSQNRYPVSIIANEACTLLSIPKNDFLRMMQSSEQVLRNFLHAISSRGQFLSSKIRFLSFSTIREKMAQYLLDLAVKQGSDSLRMAHTQSELSELFGVTRPSLGRTISEMNREGLIRSEGKVVRILDKDGLSSILNRF